MVTKPKGYNDSIKFIDEIAQLVRDGNPHFIELKSYMHIGMSTQRLEKDNMLEMEEIRTLALKLHDANPMFSIMDESEISRIVVLQNHDRYAKRWIDTYVT